MGGEVLVDGAMVELRQLLDGGLQRMMTLVPAIANGQGQDQVLLGQLQVLVVKLPKLLLADHDLLFVRVALADHVLLFVRVALAADVELLGLLLFLYFCKYRI